MAIARATVVGAGIHGLWIAWRLLAEGYLVTLLDRGAIPNPDGASSDEHRLIHPLHAQTAADLDRLQNAFSGWEQLWHALGRTHYRETGAVGGSHSSGPELFAALAEAAPWCARLISPADLADVVPRCRWRARGAIIAVDHSGVLLANRIVRDLARLLAEAGCSLRAGCAVSAIDPASGWVWVEGGDRIDADVLVVATGADTGAWLPAMAPRLRPVRQTTAYFEPPASVLPGWRRAPVFVDIGASGDLWGAPPVAGTRLKFAASGLARAWTAEDPISHPATVAALLDRVNAAFDTQGWRLSEIATRHYAHSVAGPPLIEALPGSRGRAWIVAGCNGAGFKSAPVVAEEIITFLRHGCAPIPSQPFAATAA